MAFNITEIATNAMMGIYGHKMPAVLGSVFFSLWALSMVPLRSCIRRRCPRGMRVALSETARRDIQEAMRDGRITVDELGDFVGNRLVEYVQSISDGKSDTHSSDTTDAVEENVDEEEENVDEEEEADVDDEQDAEEEKHIKQD